MRQYDYHISISDVIPPIGGNLRYAAKVDYVYRNDGDEMEVKLSVDFEETFGETREEAEQKMREVVEAWIADRRRLRQA